MARKYDKQSGLFKKDIPEMPEGYYSGDRPNPNLRAFVEAHVKERPYDPENDDYDVRPLINPVTGKKNTSLYQAHTYWSKKPFNAIRAYIRHFTRPKDIVLDPFCGCGGTLIAAMQEGCSAIGLDLSPTATFISYHYIYPVDYAGMQEAQDFVCDVASRLNPLYEVFVDGTPVKATSFIWSERYRCIKCFALELVYNLKFMGNMHYCPHCGELIPKRSKNIEYSGEEIVAFEYKNGRKTKRIPIDEHYLEGQEKASQRIDELLATHWYPQLDIPVELLDYGGRLRSTNTLRVDQLYTQRALAILAVLREEIWNMPEGSGKRLCEFAFSSILLNATKMYLDRSFGSGTSAGGGKPSTYFIPSVRKEINIIDAFEAKLRTIIKGKKELVSNSPADNVACLLSTDSADRLDIPDNTIDYIFTDPPYADTMPFGALNCIWDAWLGFGYKWRKKEAISNNWKPIVEGAIREMFRVLKPGRWLSLCYHDASAGTWEEIQDMFAEAGFITEKTDTAIYIDSTQKTYMQKVGSQITKRDLVINFRKPKPGEVTAAVAITGDEDKATFSEKVRQIIREYLGAHPGASKDRIYDEVVSNMVRSGRMEAHDFDELLGQVAEEVKTPVRKDLFRNGEANLFGTHEVGRWYLKETELAVSDEAETAKEDAAAERIGAFIEGYVKKHPDEEGVHYSDLFEHYVYSVKDKPRRQLAEFLPDYFYKTDLGTWRLPASEEEKRAKAEGRAKGVGRRVKRYIAQLEQGIAIPENERPNDATLAEWIRHCKRAGLYEQGKLLYEKGGLDLDSLPEEAMVNVEEDYQVCVRMLVRSDEAEKGKKRKRRKL